MFAMLDHICDIMLIFAISSLVPHAPPPPQAQAPFEMGSPLFMRNRPNIWVFSCLPRYKCVALEHLADASCIPPNLHSHDRFVSLSQRGEHSLAWGRCA